jgi:predicted ArsR family transcriptional regulator
VVSLTLIDDTHILPRQAQHFNNPRLPYCREVTDAWEATAALMDRVRRRLYEHVRGQGQPVTRDEAASAVGVSRGLAAFHLDKLVRAGLLTAGYRTRPGTPRGPGRAPKVYQPSDLQVSLTIPQRRYDLLGDILVRAIAEGPQHVGEATDRIAQQRGTELGRAAGRTPVLSVLAGLGFEPHERSGRIGLRNCPFQPLAATAPQLVCRLNQRFLAGLLHGLGDTGHRAVLAPQPGACCVQLRP